MFRGFMTAAPPLKRSAGTHRYDFAAISAQAARGDAIGSQLARDVGTLGYHDEGFANLSDGAPYPDRNLIILTKIGLRDSGSGHGGARSCTDAQAVRAAVATRPGFALVRVSAKPFFLKGLAASRPVAPFQPPKVRNARFA